VILEPGSDFAGFRVEEMIARGGMGEIYRAENPRLGTKVALKVLPFELAEGDLFRERFVRESRVAASLAHPNVVPIFDAGEERGIFYIAMRFVEGLDLKALIAREGRLDPQWALAIVGQAANALDAAHARSLVHRDVKPANILIDESAPGAPFGHVYLSDFGVAKHRLSHSGLTSTGQFIGTIDYVAPEQIEGKTVDERTDVYSLGCVLYECLTGSPPFERDSNPAMIYAHLVDAPPSVTARVPELPDAIDDVIAVALAKDRDQRYQSCGALVAAANDALGFAAATAEGAMTVPPASPEPAPTPAPETVLAATPAAPPTAAAEPSVPETVIAPSAAPPPPLAAPAVAATPSPDSAPVPPFAPPAPPGPRRRLSGRAAVIAVAVALVAAAGAAGAGTMLLSSSSDHSSKAGDDGSAEAGEDRSSESAGNRNEIVDEFLEARRRAERRQRRIERRRERVEQRQRIERRREERQRVQRIVRRREERQRRIEAQRAAARAEADRIRQGTTGSSSSGSSDRLNRTPPPPPSSSDRLRSGSGGSSGSSGGGGGDRLRP
jgi:hypothetical protein